MTVAAAAAFAGTVALIGASWAQAVHPRQTPMFSAQPQASGAALGTLCAMGYDTQTSTLVPPDDSTSDNPPAASVAFLKDCTGPVVGRFSAEVSTANAGDFIHIDMRATCLATGGLAGACTVGQQVFASPGHTFFRNTVGTVQTHAITMVWPRGATVLKRGRWRFEVLPGGNNSANLQFRAFTVEAFSNN